MADTTSRRIRGLNLLRTSAPSPYAFQLEYAIYRHNPADYETKVRQMTWNLRQSPALAKHDPHQLVCMSDRMMASGTDIEAWHDTFRKTLEAEDNLINYRPSADTGSLIKCRRCKSNNLVTTLVQTRASDEPMTVIQSCDDCGMRWRTG